MTLFKIVAIAEVEYELVMHLTFGGPEDYNSFGLFPSRDAVIAFYRSQLIEQPYEEEKFDPFSGTYKKYIRYFKKGSPLEWLDPLTEEQLHIKPCPLNFGVQEIVRSVKQIFEKEEIHG